MDQRKDTCPFCRNDVAPWTRVMRAASQAPWTLSRASSVDRRSPDVVFSAARKNGEWLRFADDRVLDDVNCMRDFVRVLPPEQISWMLEYASKRVLSDPLFQSTFMERSVRDFESDAEYKAAVLQTFAELAHVST